MSLRVDKVSAVAGHDVIDEYGRVVGTLISLNSDVRGQVTGITLKLGDTRIFNIPGERVTFKDGSLVVTPEWKYEALTVIEALDRAYKRRRGIERIIASGDIPDEVIEQFKNRLNDEIKTLKIRAEEVKKTLRSKVEEIEDEYLKVSGAIVSLQMLYFSGEIGERNYVQSMNHLRKIRDALVQEKADVKTTLDRLEKTIEVAGKPFEAEEEHVPESEAIVVKVEEA